MAVGDKSHLNNYQRAPVYPIMPNSSNAPMNFRADALNTSIINPNEATGGNALNFSKDASTSAEPLVINRNPNLLDDSSWMSNDMDLTYTDPYSQAEKEQMMADRYASTLVSPGINIFGKDIGKQYGYTGQGSQSRAGINAPAGTASTATPSVRSSAQPSGPAPIPQVLISQDLTQRAPSGTIYSPDLSAYYDSSLFDYAGPGGVDEYTYGQGLRTGGADYSIFGSPTDIANPYYEGQFAPVAQPVVSEPVGPADGAINMNPVQLPSDLPQVTVPTSPSVNQMVGGSLPTDLTYAQTLAEMNIDPLDAPRTTFPRPGDSTQDMTASDNEFQEMLNQSLMDNQTQAETAMGDRSGFPDFVGGSLPTDLSMANNQSQADMAMGDRAGFPNEVLYGGSSGSPNGRGGFDLYYDRDDVPKMTLTPENITEAASERAKRESEQFLARDVAAGMNDNITELMAKGQALQDRYDAQERVQTKDRVLNQQFDRNQAEYVPTISDYFPDASPLGFAETAGDEGFTPKIGPRTGPSGLTANDVVVDTTPSPTLSDVTDATPMQFARGGTPFDGLGEQRYVDTSRYVKDATPMQFASNAGQMEARNTSIFDAKREDSPFAKGPAQEIKNIFDEQQNYEVPASEMSPGEVGLVNGLLEGAEAVYEGAFSVDGSGTDRIKTPEESAAWDKYYSYKSAGIDALNKGEIDVKAFNELKGKAGSDTVINHFVDTNKNPLINNSIANTANVLYQAMDVITGDDTIKEGITDFFQQKKGVDDDTPLGSIGEEIAKAKKATQQRKEVQENIFTPGPMKFAAVASKPKPTPVKSSPAIRTSSQKNVISKPKAKPGGRAGAGATTNKYNSFAKNYGGRYGL